MRLFLQRRDVEVIAAASAGVLVAGLFAARVFGPATASPSLCALSVGAVLVAIAYLARREQALNQGVRDSAANYRQIEALFGLFSVLRIRRPLPPMRGYASSPDVLAVLVSEALQSKPRAVVECGSGVSTLLLAYCFERTGSGHVWSLESDAAYAEQTERLLAKHGLESYATILRAALKAVQVEGRKYHWYDTAALERLPHGIDILYVDGPIGLPGTSARYPAVPLLMPRLSPDALIMMDDYIRVDEKRIGQRWRELLANHVLEEPEAEKGLLVLRCTTPFSAA